MKSIQLIDLGVIDYKEALDYQNELFSRMQRGEAEDSLLLCEHPHVYTLGRHGHRDNILVSKEFLSNINATYYEVDRGGDITYHGFGQIVGYPIINLKNFSLTLKRYVELLEEAVIRCVANYGIVVERIDGATGVWYRDGVKDRKICAIGVKASRFITMHGFALNVNTDLNYFNYINPCGFTEKGVTSLRELLGTEYVDIEEVKRLFCKEFFSIIGAEIK